MGKQFELEFAQNIKDYTFQFYGGAREMVNCRDSEVVLHGAAETGKTLSILWKLHIAAMKYPGASIVIMRKTQTSVYSSTLQTFMNKVLGPNEMTWPCIPYGGNKPEWFDYVNKSRIWIAGMDKSSRVLSSEHDIVFWNQVEEATVEEWEVCTTRTTGRAGHIPHSQTIGDCNPAWPTHWMYNRPSLKIFYSHHTENPVLYDQDTGEITQQGERTIGVLSALTGVRRTRYLEGKPAQAEGIVYDEWDPSYHLIAEAPECSRHIAGVDWGYRKPGCIIVFGIDGDDNAYVKAQIYRREETIDWWAARAQELRDEFKIETFICDPSEPGYIEKFRLAGLNSQKANNAILPGINAVKDRFGRDGLFVIIDNLRYTDSGLLSERKAHKLQDEFLSYVWSNVKTKEIPIKEDDHAMDVLRYVTMYIDRPVGHLFTVLEPTPGTIVEGEIGGLGIIAPSVEEPIPSGWPLPLD
jgi:phage terminase large subunit